MLKGLVETGLRFRYLMLAILVALFGLGYSQLRSMPVDVLPEYSPPYVEVQTEALGLSAKEVEQLITVPIEQDLLSGVAWISTIRSQSVAGLSSIVMLFEPGTDLYRARQMVTERMTQAHALPHVSKPPTMLQPLSATSRFMVVGLTAQEITPIQMSVLARWTVVPRLMSVPGVANVSIWGQRDRQLQVLVNPEELKAKGVTLQQVVETTGNALWVSSLSYLEASTPGTGGFIDTPQQRLGIWHVSPIDSADALAQVALEGANKRLGDVARVVEDHQPLIGDAIVGDSPGLVLVIEKLPGANTLDATRGVERALEGMKPGLKGMSVNTGLFRPASYIEAAMNNLAGALSIGAMLLVLFMLAMLRGWRASLVAAVAIVTSLVAALFVLSTRGFTLNVMLLTGLIIAIGSIVDGALGDSSRLAEALRSSRALDREAREDVQIEIASAACNTLLPAVLIVLLVTLPAFVIPGITGDFVGPMFQAHALAVIAAMAVSLLVIPGVSLILAPAKGREPAAGESLPPAFMRRIEQSYGGLLAKVSGDRRPAFAITALLLICALTVVPLLMQQRSTLTRFRETELIVNVEAAPGASHPAMVALTNKALAALRAVPGVRSVGAHIGRAIFGDQVVNINSARLIVGLDPAADYDATVTGIESAAAGFSDAQFSVSTYLRDRTDGIALSPPPQSPVVRIYGENLDLLKTQAESVKTVVGTVAGAANIRVLLPVEEPAIEIKVDLERAEKSGIKPGDVRRAAAILASGLQVGSLFEDQKVFEVVVWGVPESRRSIDDLKQLTINTPSGGHVKLGEVADVILTTSPSVIHRESISPYLDVAFDAQGASLATVVDGVRNAVSGLQMPLEYHVRVRGDPADFAKGQQWLLLVIAMAALGIVLLLQTVSERWPLSVATIALLPLALGGGLLVALLGGKGLSVLGVLGGLLAVFGLTVRQSISTISYLHRLQHDSGEPFGPELVLRGARERVVPILMGTLATALLLLPFALGGARPGLEMPREIALVALGGLVSAILFSLFLLPVLYLRYGQLPKTAPWMSANVAPMPSM